MVDVLTRAVFYANMNVLEVSLLYMGTYPDTPSIPVDGVVVSGAITCPLFGWVGGALE